MGSCCVIIRDISRSSPRQWAPRTSPHLHENCKVTQQSQARPNCYSLVKTYTSNSSREERMWIWPFLDVRSPHPGVFGTPWSKCSSPILSIHFFSVCRHVLSAYWGEKGKRERVTIFNSGLLRPPWAPWAEIRPDGEKGACHIQLGKRKWRSKGSESWLRHLVALWLWASGGEDHMKQSGKYLAPY